MRSSQDNLKSEARNPKPAERVRQVVGWGVADSLLVANHCGRPSCDWQSSESATFEHIKTRIS
jgi:hypothetical protein